VLEGTVGMRVPERGKVTQYHTVVPYL